ncbi:hypothetical protein [Legionella hackeliae]|uniref:Uncharacterized protein n=1 Tax=Legionella hackeliae TaxID=449 RepID=A0A0A8URE2_LEGHA|nr:hypothetical protein [Legionella hackeliae]KTD10123.1 hypothetical protein Lhac_2491 [Legionella hackeliae]CEK09612.1 conserved exported protein of unknown function [Legionella hackeliae]STX49527.1 Uncharacterised protein [Legionella hackeliae]
MKIILFLGFMTMSFASSGAIIFVQGLPMALEQRNDVYLLPPSNVTPSNAVLFYITMDGVNKLCVLDTHINGGFYQITQVAFLINGNRTVWNCYAYETEVVKVLPW